MCGIVGIARTVEGALISPAQIRAMCSQIEYRGPDDEGIEVRDDVGLGMRRLSIIDLHGSKQPISNEDDTVRTVFNGEIYNFKELRKTLVARGHRFRTNGDTEVLVHAYEEYGLDFPKYLNGMFAVTIHDSANRKLVLARDHLGIKPLYYAHLGENLVWGSEIKTLLASGLIEPELDLTALNQFLTWEYVPGEDTLLRGVQKLRPGHMLTVDLDDLSATVRQYWDIPHVKSVSRSVDDWTSAIDLTIKQSVRAQMVSDVPLGAFLSGGVDSSLVAAAMGDAQTFSIGFDDPSYNELAYSKEVANHLGMTHFTEVIRPQVADLFDLLMNHLDDPIGDFSIFPTFLVSRLAKEQVTVVLSGDGADEIFGGYETYVAQNIGQQYARIPKWARKGLIEPSVARLRPRSEKKGLINKARRFVEGAAEQSAMGHCRWRMFLSDAIRTRLFTPDAMREFEKPAEQHILDLFGEAGDRSEVDKALYVDTKSYLCDNILTKVDRMSMAVSLEARVPLLDRNLVELAFSVPAELKVAGSNTKVLLKQVAARYVPRNCVYREKEGFSIPIKTWLGTQFRPIMEDLLDKKRIHDAGLFQADTIEELKTEHLIGIANHSHLLWSLIVFEAWRDRWLQTKSELMRPHRLAVGEAG
jgi:asparagine synthase (glutamine-hydrolysing)